MNECARDYVATLDSIKSTQYVANWYKTYCKSYSKPVEGTFNNVVFHHFIIAWLMGLCVWSQSQPQMAPNLTDGHVWWVWISSRTATATQHKPTTTSITGSVQGNMTDGRQFSGERKGLNRNRKRRKHAARQCTSAILMTPTAKVL